MFLSHQIKYQLKFSWLKRVWVIVNEFLTRNRRFDLKWPRLTFDLRKSRCAILAYLRSLLVQKNLLKMVTCVRHISRKFQFCKSIFSKFWIFLDLETKILINFSTPKNPYITFLDRSRNTQKSRCSFSFNPPNKLHYINYIKIYLFRKISSNFYHNVRKTDIVGSKLVDARLRANQRISEA